MADYKRLVDVDGTDRFERLGAILAAVEQHGSLNRATAALGISYRQAWGLVKQAEALLGGSLLTRRVGGAAGGGAELTESAHNLLARYRLLQSEVAQIFGSAPPDVGRPVLIASTIGPVEVGLVDALEAAFHRETGLWIRHIAAGTGEAIEIARAGRVDLLLTHAPEAEAEFIGGGWGARRFPLMTNGFLICGPSGDPAGAASTPSGAIAAMQRIAQAGVPFLSRGDRSGTHLKEEALWQAAGVTPGPWRMRFERGGQGSGLTLREANRLGAYTLVDRATFATVAPPALVVLVEGDPLLENLFSLLSLNPNRFPAANHAGAEQFIGWALGPGGSAIIMASGHFRPIGN